MPPANGNALTIDDLAREVGMTVRNVRAHQSRGLLPPPEIRGRTGYYGSEHVARLRLIQELQGEGFNLKSIDRLLGQVEGADEQLLRFRSALLNSFTDEEPELITAEELAARFGGQVNQDALRKATRMGVIQPLGEGRFEVPSPTLLRAGEELVALGIPLEHALAVAERVQKASRSIAASFVRLFMTDVVGQVEESRSPADWERLREALERLGPLATEVVRASFQQTMSTEVERQLEKVLGVTKQ
ncbi:MAG: MerR family transcriptional regulator [Thermoleophilaceae bacterium]